MDFNSIIFLQFSNLLSTGQIEKLFENKVIIYGGIFYGVYLLFQKFYNKKYPNKRIFDEIYNYMGFNKFPKQMIFEYKSNSDARETSTAKFMIDAILHDISQEISYNTNSYGVYEEHHKSNNVVLTCNLLPTEDIIITRNNIQFKIFCSKTTKDSDTAVGAAKVNIAITNIYLAIESTNLNDIKKYTQECYNKYCVYKEMNRGDIKNSDIIYFPYIDKHNGVRLKKYKHENTKNLKNVFINQKEELINHIERFNDKNDKTLQKMSLLLHGPPGTGKTSIIKSIANELNRSIIYVKLSKIKTLDDLLKLFYEECFVQFYDLRYSYTNIKKTDKIIVFEDIDGECPSVLSRDFLDQQKEKEEKEKDKKEETPEQKLITQLKDNESICEKKCELTLADILQVFDGVIENTNIVTIVTTNYLERLDSAFIRNGRVTLSINLNKINDKTIKQMISKYYPNAQMDEIIFKDILPCNLENLCIASTSFENLQELIKKHHEEEVENKDKKQDTSINYEKLYKELEQKYKTLEELTKQQNKQSILTKIISATF